MDLLKAYDSPTVTGARAVTAETHLFQYVLFHGIPYVLL